MGSLLIEIPAWLAGSNYLLFNTAQIWRFRRGAQNLRLTKSRPCSLEIQVPRRRQRGLHQARARAAAAGAQHGQHVRLRAGRRRLAGRRRGGGRRFSGHSQVNIHPLDPVKFSPQGGPSGRGLDFVGTELRGPLQSGASYLWQGFEDNVLGSSSG